MDLKHLVGRNIQRRREFIGIKQETLARLLGISSAAVSQIENGHSDVSLSRLAQVAEVLQVAPDQLVFGLQDGQQVNTPSVDSMPYLLLAERTTELTSVVVHLAERLTKLAELMGRSDVV